MGDQQPWLDDLNPQQREAVTAGDGPLLVVAGAGSGKTRTLAYRVAHLVAHGVRPERILLLTFTRRAAEQMLSRAAAATAMGSAVTARVWGGTFHAIANRLLRVYAEPAGLSPDFTIMDQADAADLINVIRHEMNLAGKGKRFPRKNTCIAIYSRRMNGAEELQDVLDKYFPWCAKWEAELAKLFKGYVDRKQKQQVLDYDDLLFYWNVLLEDEAVAESISDRFDHILVDEYQDTNIVQSQILRGMRRKNHNIMVVGDDAQSIYSFRAATVRNMLDFPEQFPDARIITLDQNYRSTEPILEATNRVIAQAPERYSKTLWSTRRAGQKPRLITCRDEAGQDDVVIRQILEHYEQGIALREQAVLFRAASHSNSLELALTERNIPYHKYGGLRFLEAAHIKDLISILRILENPQDELAWFRVLQLFDGVGPATASAAFDHVARNRWRAETIGTFEAPAAARDQIAQFTAMLHDLANLPDARPSVQIERIRRFYDPVLQRTYENPQPRANDIEHLGHLAERYRSRRRFLAELILDPPTSTSDLAGPPSREEDWLVLSTIHSAKGCEWDAVYLIHAADGCLPSDMGTSSPEEIAEELRLTYVAMTRARDFLYVTWPLRYYHRKHRRGDAHSYAQCCRFFTDDVLATMDQVTDGSEEADDQGVSAKPAQDIAKRLRQMW